MLRALLDKLLECCEPKTKPDFSKPVSVVLERVIPQNRRIDITVDIATDRGPWCLAIENKPYADDQRRQVKAYLAYLKTEYEGRFLLVYLSPRGQGPTCYSLPKEDIPCWRGWFAACRAQCEAARL